MHCLEVIVARNERAAAREEAHAVNDGNTELAIAIALENPITDNYSAGYHAAREEN